jgi:NAD(P)-dependent dehydrogenase (short-subunit alcohol dehydrogenase family)
MQVMQDDVRDITEEQLDGTFRTNVYSMFFMAQECLQYMKPGSCIINTTSVVGFKGNPSLMDYTATKGAAQSWTYALSNSLVSKGIRVNAVAPGPIWTPFIPSSFPAEKVGKFGSDVPMGRPGQPEEVAPAYVFLASHDASYISGQTIHVNGGVVVAA